MTMVPCEVTMVAVYRLAVSMTIGGSWSNFRCCGLDPSAAGGVGTAMGCAFPGSGPRDGAGDDALGQVGRNAGRGALGVDLVHHVHARGDLAEQRVGVG